MTPDKKIYFLSDFHLGVPDYTASRERENRIVKFLDSIKHDASEVFLLGDLFDFWFEYKTAVPKGFIRLQGKLAELSDAGIKLHLFTGNHDMWMFGYFEQELNVTMYRKPQTFLLNNKKFYIGHGDGLGPGDKQYKRFKAIFRNRFCQWLFGKLHPDMGIGIANHFSNTSRESHEESDKKFMGEDKEWLVVYCKEVLQKEHFDFFIFGHRHLVLDIDLGSESRYINTGDWIRYNSYAVFDGQTLQLKKFEA
ncbi:MAG: UDP-2,3-diacylglucosamine diphosphatase [Bacteroidia bacterium]|nr:UDP-2,3-diacylglucosamine diphosphatase [Bacteroidia bacterium]